ncbi:MAG: S8 family serine peptidase [Anaerolineaceae bacterium]|nr:S8 family serine peptidase [Anaerolineaceae bacterium]
MKKSIFLLFVFVALMAVLSVSTVAAQSNRFRGEKSYIVIAQNEYNLPPALLQQLRARGAEIEQLYANMGMVSVSSSNPATLAGLPGVRSVVPNIQFHAIEPTRIQNLPGGFVASPPNTTDDDGYFNMQWGHDAVNVPEAWAQYGATGAGVRVAVLDSGIDATHPDLAPNVNTALSKSFVPGEDWQVQPGFYFNHGTHVAGIIAAADNGFGIIGVAPNAEIMAVKVLSEYTGSGDFDWVMNGIVYAANNGADIINMSLGATLPLFGDCDIYPPDECITAREVAELVIAMHRVTRYAYHRGVTIIASAGNDAIDFDHQNPILIDLPAMLPYVVAVSATAPVGWAVDPTVNLDNLSSYSNYGNVIVDFAAPGGDYILPGDDVCEVDGVVNYCWVFDMVFSDIPGGYSWAAGTSMAAPYASGVAALIIGGLGGSASPWQVISIMRAASNDLGAPGKDPLFGYGRVNVDWSQRG